MRVNEPPAFEHFDERLELKVAPRRHEILARLLPAVVVLPLFLVRLRARERVADDVLDAHSRGRVPRGPVALPASRAAARALRILAERELDPRHRTVEEEILGARFSPPQLDHLVLAA